MEEDGAGHPVKGCRLASTGWGRDGGQGHSALVDRTESFLPFNLMAEKNVPQT